MTRFAALLGALCMVLIPCVGSAQVALPPGPGVPTAGPGFPGASLLSPFRGPGAPPYEERSPDESWSLRAQGRAGYMWMLYSVNFPFQNADFIGTPAFVGADISLKDGGYWMGITGLEVQPIEDLFLYGRLGAIIPKDSIVEMSFTGAAGRTPTSVPMGSGANTVSPWEWTAEQFFWWMVEGGAAFMLTRAFALDIGFRAEHIDFHMRSPRNRTQALNNNPPGFAITSDRI
ncbi:MAG: hypothetical protein AB1473_12490 [Thermodesulfobacteriota bacterium]